LLLAVLYTAIAVVANTYFPVSRLSVAILGILGLVFITAAFLAGAVPELRRFQAIISAPQRSADELQAAIKGRQTLLENLHKINASPDVISLVSRRLSEVQDELASLPLEPRAG
jgi:hypothetical protein